MTDEKSTGDSLEGIYGRVPLADLTLEEARDLVDDASWFDVTRIQILHEFPQVRVGDYWSLTVKDHTEMVAYLKIQGAMNGIS